MELKDYQFTRIQAEDLFEVGYLLMDELVKAVSQFCPSFFEGMSGGSSNPPGPVDNPPFLFFMKGKRKKRNSTFQ
jgi:hypothetical protein